MGVYKVNQETGEIDLIAGGTLYADAPVGAIIPYGGSTAPSGWLLCQGQAVSRTDYAELFAAIGTAFGTGDGSTTFNVPDLREATTKGAGMSGKSSNHYDSDGVALGEFVEDRIQNITGSITPKSVSDVAAGNYSAASGAFSKTAIGSSRTFSGSSSQYNVVKFDFDASNVARTGTTTEVKAVGVNYIIKAKQTALPLDITAGIEDMLDEVTAVIPSNATSANLLTTQNELNEKQNKTLTVPLTINGASQTTVEGALGALNTVVTPLAENRFVINNTHSSSDVTGYWVKLTQTARGDRNTIAGVIPTQTNSHYAIFDWNGWSSLGLVGGVIKISTSIGGYLSADIYVQENPNSLTNFVEGYYDGASASVYLHFVGAWTQMHYITLQQSTFKDTYSMEVVGSTEYAFGSAPDSVPTSGTAVTVTANLENYARTDVISITTEAELVAFRTSKDTTQPFYNAQQAAIDSNGLYLPGYFRGVLVSNSSALVLWGAVGNDKYMYYYGSNGWQGGKILTTSDLTSTVASGSTAPITAGGIYSTFQGQDATINTSFPNYQSGFCRYVSIGAFIVGSGRLQVSEDTKSGVEIVSGLPSNSTLIPVLMYNSTNDVDLGYARYEAVKIYASSLKAGHNRFSFCGFVINA